jgi:hypothetical protein
MLDGIEDCVFEKGADIEIEPGIVTSDREKSLPYSS